MGRYKHKEDGNHLERRGSLREPRTVVEKVYWAYTCYLSLRRREHEPSQKQPSKHPYKELVTTKLVNQAEKFTREFDTGAGPAWDVSFISIL